MASEPKSPELVDSKKGHRASSNSCLARAFDLCPLALFPFLTDVEAAKVARALCVPRFLASKGYASTVPKPIAKVVRGLYPIVVRSVVFLVRQDDVRWLAQVPSTVTSMRFSDEMNGPGSRWQVRDLPRSLTQLHYRRMREHGEFLYRKPSTTKDWPPGLLHVELHEFPEALPPLPTTIRSLTYSRSRSEGAVDLSAFTSLTTLRLLNVTRPIATSALPPHLTSLEMVWRFGSFSPRDLDLLPESLTRLSVQGKLQREPGDTATLWLPPSLRSLRMPSALSQVLYQLPELLEELVMDREWTWTAAPASAKASFSLPHPLRHATLRSLSLFDCAEVPIRPKDFPSLQKLSLGRNYSHALQDLPASLLELTLQEDKAYQHALSLQKRGQLSPSLRVTKGAEDLDET